MKTIQVKELTLRDPFFSVSQNSIKNESPDVVWCQFLSLFSSFFLFFSSFFTFYSLFSQITMMEIELFRWTRFSFDKENTSNIHRIASCEDDARQIRHKLHSRNFYFTAFLESINIKFTARWHGLSVFLSLTQKISCSLLELGIQIYT